MKYKPQISIDELKSNYDLGVRDFRNSDFDSTHFKDLNLSDVDFTGSWFHSSIFENCNLSRTNFHECNMKCIEFRDSILFAAVFTNSSIDGTTFDDCDLRAANFDNAGWYGGVVTTERLFELNKDRNRTV